jgi:hypothetical protein
LHPLDSDDSKNLLWISRQCDALLGIMYVEHLILLFLRGLNRVLQESLTSDLLAN